jgi:glycosyltransferase involved in cell wall biosynthesis
MAPPPRVVVLCDRYPELSETFIATEVHALRAAGADVTVEALAAPDVPAPGGEPPAAVWERERTATRAAAVVRLAARHPAGVLRDLRSRPRWRRSEDVPPLRMLAPAALRIAAGRPVHVHAQFAAGAALAAMRIARVLDVPWSFTAHGYDIFQRPANLPEKLRRATFATSGSAYTAGHLRGLAGPGADRVHVIVMGVDGERFSRRTPLPGGRTVVAVGRLVPKKGFADLVAATARLRERGQEPERVVIAGDGPLRAELEGQARDLGVGDLVRFRGAVPHAGVRDLLEQSDVLCMPCVVAADGDRDSMPVVVKEALAMELPVVATDQVGLPEVVRPPWGRLVAPHDPPALARALAATLALGPQERAEAGRAGRAHVLAACDPAEEARRLLRLIA